MRACGGTGPNGFDSAVEQLRSAVGAWEVKTTQYGDDGNVARDRFESRMEVSTDGGSSWRQGNHQVFERAQAGDGGHAGGLRFRKPARNYVPLT